MCTSSYKAPAVAPVPPPPPAPTEGAQAPVINDGTPGGVAQKLGNLASSFNSLVVPYVGRSYSGSADATAKKLAKLGTTPSPTYAANIGVNVPFASTTTSPLAVAPKPAKTR